MKNIIRNETRAKAEAKNIFEELLTEITPEKALVQDKTAIFTINSEANAKLTIETAMSSDQYPRVVLQIINKKDGVIDSKVYDFVSFFKGGDGIISEVFICLIGGKGIWKNCNERGSFAKIIPSKDELECLKKAINDYCQFYK